MATFLEPSTNEMKTAKGKFSSGLERTYIHPADGTRKEVH